MRRWAARSALLFGFALVAGCADPSEAPTAASTIDASPTPPAASPTFLLGLSCADILSAADVAEFVHVHVPAPVLLDETTGLAWPEDVAVAQHGGLDCAWATPPLPVQFIGDQVRVTVRASADAFVDAPRPCDGDAEFGRACTVDFEASGMVVSLRWDNAAAPEATDAEADSMFARLRELVETRVSGTPVAKPWSVPADDGLGDALCSGDAARERIAAATQVPTDDVAVGDAALYDLGTAFANSGGVTCAWDLPGEDDDIVLAALPGGGWACKTRPPAAADWLTIAVDGVAGAWAGRRDPEDPGAIVTCHGTSFLYFSLRGGSDERAADVLSALLADTV